MTDKTLEYDRLNIGIDRLRGIQDGGYRMLFEDRFGFAIFLLGFVIGTPLISLGFAITDNYTVANTLVAVGEGSLAVSEAVYGQTLDTPGMVQSGGEAYGRNYGHVLLALPILLLLRGVSAVADPFVILAGVWSLAVYGVFEIGLSVFGFEREGALGGLGISLLLFTMTVLLGGNLNTLWFPYISLALVSVLAAGLIGTGVYRSLLGRADRRVAVAAGIVASIGTPVIFWAPIPKRHVLLAGLAVCSLFFFQRSTVQDAEKMATTYRALAYAPVGLTAWVSAPDGVILGIAVFIADIATLRGITLRGVGLRGIVIIVSFIPFVATNIAISGSPIRAPRLLMDYGTAPEPVPDSNPEIGASFVPPWFRSTPIWRIINQYLIGTAVFLTQPERVFTVFIRSEYNLATPGGFPSTDGINLSVIESVPIISPVVITLGVVASRLSVSNWKPASSDAFVGAYTLLLVLAYLPRLPLYATITVRYLVPMYPLLVYAVARLPAVRRAIEYRWKWGLWTYAGTVLIGGQLFLAGVTLLNQGAGESMQTHAVVNLSMATLLALWALAATLATRPDTSDRYDTVGAILLGLAAGAGTVLVLLATIAYFPVGEFLLPIVPSL
ncbi:hypothetical protein [Haloglomus halophilum]|uniref:hypothetical protein n=1 Tax=Haloglomus halophilum TaxID=2962672 RepID=UPI0020C9CB8D|nr:hypothetical protein [Haloglomus halophilum]